MPSENGSSTVQLDFLDDGKGESSDPTTAVAAPPREEVPDIDPDEVEVVDDDAPPPPPEADPVEEEGWKREYKERFETNYTTKINQALEAYSRGEDIDLSKFSSREKRTFNTLKSAIDTVTEPVRQSREEQSWRDYQELFDLLQTNRYEWADRMEDQNVQAFWLRMQQIKTEYGLPPNAPVQQFRRIWDQTKQSQRPAAPSGTDPGDLYEDMTERDTWAQFPPETQAKLHPDNFKGKTGVALIRAMEREYARAEAQLATTSQKQQAADRARAETSLPERARAAAAKSPPVATNSGRTPMTFGQIKAKYAETGDPKWRAAYEKAKAQRDGR